MFNLIVKDVRAFRPQLLAMLALVPGLVAIGFIPFFHMDALPVLVIVAITMQSMFALDASSFGNALYASLPYTRRDILHARYVVVFFLFGAGFSYFKGLQYLAATVIPFCPAENLSLRACLVEIAVCILMIVTYLPSFLRFGTKLLGMIVGPILFGTVAFPSIFVWAWFDPSGNIIRFPQAVSGNPTIQTLIIILTILVVLSIATLVSYRVSLRFFERKDL